MNKEEQLQKAYFQVTHFLSAMKKLPVKKEQIADGITYILGSFPLVKESDLAKLMKK